MVFNVSKGVFKQIAGFVLYSYFIPPILVIGRPACVHYQVINFILEKH